LAAGPVLVRRGDPGYPLFANTAMGPEIRMISA
jgi:hypothetical protein